MPVMPIATPMSAVLSAGASLTPSPVMATTLPARLEDVDQPHLVLGGDTRDDADLVDLRLRLLVAERGELRAGDRPPGDAELLGDGGGGDGVVAGDHAHLNASGVRLGDRGLGLGAWRIDDAHQREQRQIADEWQQVGVGIEAGGIEVFARQRHDTQPLLAQARVVGQIFLVYRVERHELQFGVEREGGAGEQLIRRAFDEAADRPQRRIHPSCDGRSP